MPPQQKSSSPDYSNQDIVRVLASPEFRYASPDLQRQVRERLGISQPSPTPQSSIGPAIPQPGPFREALGYTLGSFGPDAKKYQGNTVLEGLERSMRSTADQREREDTSDPTRSRAGAFSRQVAPRTMADVAKYTRSLLGGGSVDQAALSAVPEFRPILGAYGAITSGKELFTPRPGENEADRLERILSSLAGVAGSTALAKSGRLRTPEGEMESRISRASYASGAGPGVPNAYRLTIPDIVESARASGIKLNTPADLARAVEATSQRFQTQMGLAEQPFAGDTVNTHAAADALRQAADEMAPSAKHEAAQLRNAAKAYDRPMTLRDLGREVRQQNKLAGDLSGKSSLDLSRAKTRASVQINDILRKTLRDTYVDYLESKYRGGGGLRDMRQRWEQVLNLREALGEFNSRTGAVEGGHVEKLASAQAKFKGGPSEGDVRGVASEHGVRGYLRLPKGFRRGPETQASHAVKKAFRDEPGHRLPTRKLPALVRKPAGESPIEEVTRRGPGTPPPKEGPSAEATRTAEAAQRKASFERQLAASKKHPEWAARVRAKVEAAESAAEGGDKEAARLKKVAKPAEDTGHLQRATSELFPGKQFGELTPQQQSRAIQRSLELKAKSKGAGD